MKVLNLNLKEKVLSKAIRSVYAPIGQFIYSEEFRELARKNPGDFTRDRGLPLPELMLMILNYRKGTTNDELEQFTQAVYGQDALPMVTASAFCQARQKIRIEAFIGLNSRILDEFEVQYTLHRWHSFRLLAVDGSTGQLPNEEEILEMFGGPADANAPRARFCQMYDVLNKVIICSDMEPYEVGEREIAAPYLYEAKEDDLLLYDRGFPAFWFFAMHRDMDRSFCARVKLSHCNEVREFVASGKRTQIVTLSPSSEAKAQCKDYNLSAEPITVRLVRVELKKGGIEVLVTTLVDKRAYPSSWFKKLYHARWGVEESYKRIKTRMEIENFSGKSVATIRQDFYAKIIALNLTAILVWVAEEIARRVYEKRKGTYQINFSNALSVCKNDLIRFISKGMPWEMLLNLLTRLVSAVTEVVPDRSYPRKKKKPTRRAFHPNYKRTA